MKGHHSHTPQHVLQAEMVESTDLFDLLPGFLPLLDLLLGLIQFSKKASQITTAGCGRQAAENWRWTR